MKKSINEINNSTLNFCFTLMLFYLAPSTVIPAEALLCKSVSKQPIWRIHGAACCQGCWSKLNSQASTLLACSSLSVSFLGSVAQTWLELLHHLGEPRWHHFVPEICQDINSGIKQNWTFLFYLFYYFIFIYII